MDERIERLLDELDTPDRERDVIRDAIAARDNEVRSRQAHPSTAR